MRVKKKVFVALAISILATQAAWGAGTGWFGGISGGTRALDVDNSHFTSVIDDNQKSRKLYGAYQLSRLLGVEMGAELSRISLRDQGLVEPGSLAPGLKPKGWQLSGVGTVAVGQKLGVFGRLGAYRGELDLSPNQASAADGKTKATYGLGVMYDFSQNFRIQGGWDRYRLSIGTQSGEGSDVDLLTIGLKYKF
jgi:Outer membrane protein beta-barrel domain